MWHFVFNGELLSVIYTFFKESMCDTGDLGSIPGSGRSPGKRNGYPLHYSCLENSMDRGTWLAIHSWGRKELPLTLLHMLLCKKLIRYK